MLDHVSIGVRDLARTKRFYDAALRPLGYTLLTEIEGTLGYGREVAALWISAAKHPVSPDFKFCFAAPSRDSVDTFQW